MSDLTTLGAEPACLVSVPHVLLKKPEERGGFDQVVVSAVRDFLAKQVREVDGRLASNEAESAKAAAEVGRLRETLARATAARDADAEAASAAQASYDDKLKQKLATETAIENDRVDGSNHEAMAEVTRQNALDFESLLGTFGELCKRSSAAEPEAAPAGAAEEDGTMADAAAETAEDP